MNGQELITVLKQNRFAVFGTGFVSEMFWHALKINGLEKNITGYIVSAPGSERFHGLPVSGISSVQKNTIICLAVHDANRAEITGMLKSSGYDTIIWVYPYIHELIFGPVRYTEDVDLRELIRRQEPSYFWIAARYSIPAGEREEIYLKAIAAHAGRRTAERRLRQYRELIQSFENRGYDPSYPILIDTRGRIIDGLHRLALAVYHGLPSIRCQVTDASENYGLILHEENYLPQNKLTEYGFTAEEIAILQKLQKDTGIDKSTGQAYREV